MKSISVLPAVCCLLSVVSAQMFDSLCAIQCGPDTFVAQVPANGPYPWFYDSSSNQLVFTQYSLGWKTYMLDCSTDSVVDSADVFFTEPAVFDRTDRKVYGLSNRYSPDFVVTDLNARTQRVLLHGPFEGGAVAWIPSANKVCFSDYGRTYRLYFFDCANDSRRPSCRSGRSLCA